MKSFQVIVHNIHQIATRIINYLSFYRKPFGFSLECWNKRIFYFNIKHIFIQFCVEFIGRRSTDGSVSYTSCKFLAHYLSMRKKLFYIIIFCWLSYVRNTFCWIDNSIFLKVWKYLDGNTLSLSNLFNSLLIVFLNGSVIHMLHIASYFLCIYISCIV